MAKDLKISLMSKATTLDGTELIPIVLGGQNKTTTTKDLKSSTLDTIYKENEPYYDDGTGLIVPIKHPDLCSEPTILPYKIGGRTVYEQAFLGNTDGSEIIIPIKNNIPEPGNVMPIAFDGFYEYAKGVYLPVNDTNFRIGVIDDALHIYSTTKTKYSITLRFFVSEDNGYGYGYAY